MFSQDVVWQLHVVLVGHAPRGWQGSSGVSPPGGHPRGPRHGRCPHINKGSLVITHRSSRRFVWSWWSNCNFVWIKIRFMFDWVKCRSRPQNPNSFYFVQNVMTSSWHFFRRVQINFWRFPLWGLARPPTGNGSRGHLRSSGYDRMWIGLILICRGCRMRPFWGCTELHHRHCMTSRTFPGRPSSWMVV